MNDNQITDLEQANMLLRNDNIKLGDENQRLRIENKDYKFKNKKLSTDLNKAEEIILKYKKKSKYLINSTEILEDNFYIYIEEIEYFKRECEHYRLLCEENKLQIDNLNVELHNLCKDVDEGNLVVQQTEEERNIALNGAEKLKSSYLKLKGQMNTKIKELLNTIEKFKKENDDLIQINKNLEEEITKLKVQFKIATKDLTYEKNQNKKLDAQLKEYMHQLKLKEQGIKKLENDMVKFDDIKRENKRINIYITELKKKIEVLEGEILDSKKIETKNQNLIEKLRQAIRKNNNTKYFNENVKDLSNMTHNKCNDKGLNCKESTEDKLLDKINLLKSKITSRNYDKKDFILQTDQPISNSKLSPEKLVINLENVFAEIEIDRSNFLDLVSCLEAKISNLLVNKVSMEAQLTERSNQLMEIQKELKEKMSSDSSYETECRKKAYHISILESQVENSYTKLKEFESKSDRLENNLSEKILFCDEIEKTLQKVQELLIQKSYDLEISASSLIELQIEHDQLNEQNKDLKENLSMSENKCKDLQTNLNEVLKAANSIKFDIQQSNEHYTIMINSLENELTNKTNKCIHLEEELTKLGAKFKLKVEEFDAKYKLKVEEFDVTKFELNENENKLMNKIKSLELECSELLAIISENKNQFKYFKDEIQFKETILKENAIKINSMNNTINDIKAQHSELLQQKMVIIDELNRKLTTVETNFDAIDKECKELSMENKSLIRERKQLLDEFSKEMKNFVKKYKKTQAVNETYKNDLNRLNLENSQLSSDVKDYKDQYNSNNEKLSQIEELLDKEKSKSISLKTEVGKQGYEIQTLNLKIKGEKNNLEKSEKELKELRKELINSKSILEQQKYEIDQMELRNTRLEEALDVKTNEIQKQNIIITELGVNSKEQECNMEEKFIQLQSEINDYKNEILNMNSKLNSLNRNMEILYNENQDLKSKNCTLSKQIERIQKENDSYKLVAENFEKVNESLKSESEKMKTITFNQEEELKTFKEVINKLEYELITKDKELSSYKFNNDTSKKNLLDLKNVIQSKEKEILELSELIKLSEKTSNNYENKILLMKNELKLENERLKADLIRMSIECDRLKNAKQNINTSK